MTDNLFIGKDIGNPARAGSWVKVPKGFDITAAGADIWGNKDEFYFVYSQHVGDFDFIVRLESLSRCDLYTKAGIMARETLGGDSKNVLMLAFPDNAERNQNNGAIEFQFRAVTGSESKAIYPPDDTSVPPLFPANFPNTWLRLSRIGNKFDAFFSLNGREWKQYASYTLNLASRLYLGIAVTSHNEAGLITAAVRDISLT